MLQERLSYLQHRLILPRDRQFYPGEKFSERYRCRGGLRTGDLFLREKAGSHRVHVQLPSDGKPSICRVHATGDDISDRKGHAQVPGVRGQSLFLVCDFRCPWLPVRVVSSLQNRTLHSRRHSGDPLLPSYPLCLG